MILAKEVTLPLLKLFYNCFIKKDLHVCVLARGLKVWCFGHRYIIYCSRREEKENQSLAKHWAFEKLPLARNQQGAVTSLVAKSCEDPDHMGCTLFQSIRRWAGFSPYVLLQALFPGQESKQGAFSPCKITMSFLLRPWGRDGKSCQVETQGEADQERRRLGSKASYRREWGLGATRREAVCVDSGDEDGMWIAKKEKKRK